jgi:hypothetical protein
VGDGNEHHHGERNSSDNPQQIRFHWASLFSLRLKCFPGSALHVAGTLLNKSLALECMGRESRAVHRSRRDESARRLTALFFPMKSFGEIAGAALKVSAQFTLRAFVFKCQQ